LVEINPDIQLYFGIQSLW